MSDSDHLLEVGRDLVKAVNSAAAHEKVLRKQWNSVDAEQARKELCKVLAVANDDRFWDALENAIRKGVEPGFAGQLASLDLERFEDVEEQLLRSAGAHPEVAAEWAGTTVLLLSTIRRGLDGDLPEANRVQASRARESVRLAHRSLCERQPGLTPPKKQRRGLWGAIHATCGLGTMSLNGAALLGAPLLGGIPAVFGGGSLIGGFVQLLNGAERIDEAMAKPR